MEMNHWVLFQRTWASQHFIWLGLQVVQACFLRNVITQSAFICAKSTIESPAQCVKSVQS